MIPIRKSFPLVLFAVVLGAASAAASQSPQVSVNSGQSIINRTTADKDVAANKTDTRRIESLDLNRVGVKTAQPVTLSLDDAIRRALESNNTIEISRADVRFQSTVVEAQRGLYDPVFTVSPNFTQNSTTGSKATHDFRINSNLQQLIRPGGGNY